MQLKAVNIERSERALQEANEIERTKEEAARIASNFNMNGATGGGRKKNNARARRR